MDKYLYNTVFIRQYDSGDGKSKKLKISKMKVVRNSGLEFEKKKSPPGTVNASKIDENIARARSKIFELGYCNPWQWFFTGTLDSKKYDRTNLEKFHKDLTQWFRDYNKKHGIKIDFLLIPELHKDGKSWHVHGLLNGLPVEHLHRFQIGDKMGKFIAEKVSKGETVYNWPEYAKKFGFCDIEPVKNHEAVCKYITKYCTEELGRCVTEVGAHLYYRSRGLKESKTIKKGSAHPWAASLYHDGFSNDYCEVVWREVSSDADISRTIQNFIVQK